jgi:hypothetical protein
MSTRPPQKRRGPETWRLIRERYVAGESAPALAVYFDVTQAAIRRRAWKGGWTRKKLTEAAEAHSPLVLTDATLVPTPPSAGVTPEAAIAGATAQAAALLAAGRAADAVTLLKAAEALQRLSGATPATPEPEPEPQVVVREPTQLEVFAIAQRLADLMLIDDPDADLHGPTAPFVYRWRAETLGPELAAWDWRRAVEHGTAEGVWDAEGRLLPIPHDPPPADPDWLERQALFWRNLQGAEWETWAREEAQIAEAVAPYRTVWAGREDAGP